MQRLAALSRPGCSVDGTTSAQNPLSQLVSRVLGLTDQGVVCNVTKHIIEENPGMISQLENIQSAVAYNPNSELVRNFRRDFLLRLSWGQGRLPQELSQEL